MEFWEELVARQLKIIHYTDEKRFFIPPEEMPKILDAATVAIQERAYLSPEFAQQVVDRWQQYVEEQPGVAGKYSKFLPSPNPEKEIYMLVQHALRPLMYSTVQHQRGIRERTIEAVVRNDRRPRRWKAYYSREEDLARLINNLKKVG
jgi:hypothetical protein